MMLYLSSVLGGPEVDGVPLDALLTRIIRSKASWASSDPQPSVEVMLYLPGSKFAPDFQGARTGRYSKKIDRLMIQVAVPPEVVTARSPERFLLRSLRDAVQMASAYFKKRKRAFPVAEYGELIGRLERELATQS
jgi:hypothetical protein